MDRISSAPGAPGAPTRLPPPPPRRQCLPPPACLQQARFRPPCLASFTRAGTAVLVDQQGIRIEQEDMRWADWARTFGNRAPISTERDAVGSGYVQAVNRAATHWPCRQVLGSLSVSGGEAVAGRTNASLVAAQPSQWECRTCGRDWTTYQPPSAVRTPSMSYARGCARAEKQRWSAEALRHTGRDTRCAAPHVPLPSSEDQRLGGNAQLGTGGRLLARLYALRCSHPPTANGTACSTHLGHAAERSLHGSTQLHQLAQQLLALRSVPQQRLAGVRNCAVLQGCEARRREEARKAAVLRAGLAFVGFWQMRGPAKQLPAVHTLHGRCRQLEHVSRQQSEHVVWCI